MGDITRAELDQWRIRTVRTSRYTYQQDVLRLIDLVEELAGCIALAGKVQGQPCSCIYPHTGPAGLCDKGECIVSRARALLGDTDD